MAKQGQFKRGIAIAAAVTYATLSLLDPFHTKAQTLGPDRIDLNKPTKIERSFSNGSWVGSYSFQFNGIDDKGQLKQSGYIYYNQQISYYPDNPDKNITALIGPDDNPKCGKVRGISFESDSITNTLIFTSLKNESEMKDKDIARIEIRYNQAFEVYHKDGTTDPWAERWVVKATVLQPPSKVSESDPKEAHYLINLEFRLQVEGGTSSIADPLIFPLNNLTLNVSFPKTSSINITSEPVRMQKVSMDGYNDIVDTLLNQTLVLEGLDENGKPATNLLRSGLPKSSDYVYPNKISINTTTYPNTYERTMWSVSDGTYAGVWFQSGGSVWAWIRAGPNSSEWKQFNKYYNDLIFRYTLDSTHYIPIYLVRNPTDSAAAHTIKNNKINWGGSTWYKSVYYKDANGNSSLTRVVSPTEFNIQLGVADYVNMTLSAPDTTITGVWEPKQTESGILLYPNPAHEQLAVRAADEGRHRLIVYDLLGRAVARSSFDGKEAVFDISALAKGAYYIYVDGKREKFIKGE